MGEISFRGVSTASLTGVYVLEMPSHKKAGKRMTEYRVKGRDGVLHVDEGFDNFEIYARLILINTAANKRQVVNAWADGTGKLITTDDLSIAYKATVKDEVDWHRDVIENIIKGFSATKQYYSGDFCRYSGNIYQFTTSHKGTWAVGDATLTPFLPKGVYDWCEIPFDCQPFMFEAVDSTINMIAGQGTIVTGGSEMFSVSNPGTEVALPLIKVYGSNTVAFDFCGEYIVINDMSANDPVTIDCETGYIYTQAGSAKEMTGNIPSIPLGGSGVYFNPEHSPTKITVTPRWRWV